MHSRLLEVTDFYSIKGPFGCWLLAFGLSLGLSPILECLHRHADSKECGSLSNLFLCDLYLSLCPLWFVLMLILVWLKTKGQELKACSVAAMLRGPAVGF